MRKEENKSKVKGRNENELKKQGANEGILIGGKGST